MRLGLLLCLLTLLFSACTESGLGPKDGLVDGGKDAGEGGVGWDSGLLPDLGPIKVCESRCLTQAMHLCLGDPADAQKSCVECLEDSHCLGNPGALGPRCDKEKKFCICATDGDCTKNLRGRRCNTTERMCTCLGDSDCGPAFPLCAGLGLARTCTRPCTGNSSCTSAAAPRCDRSSGKCVACLTGEDCEAQPNGAKCQAGSCVCAGDSDCKGTYPWGRTCGTTVSGGKRCGCVANTDCANNAHGPTCDMTSRRCSCAADSDCAAAAYPRCYSAYRGAGYSHCQAACKDNQQCARELGLAFCSKGKCTDCLKDTDCAAATPWCDAGKGRCVGCRVDADCKAGAPYCDLKRGVCKACKADGDCSAAPGGGRCLASGACGCAAASQCSGTYRWGAQCDVSLARCACAADTDCKAVATGPTCDTTLKKCTCKADTECATSPYSLCGAPYIKAGYRHCLAPCTGDTQCQARAGLSRCDTASGHCRPCLANSECAAKAFAQTCDSALGCVECSTSVACTAASLGPTCATDTGSCYCGKDADCAANGNGLRCDVSLKVCACTKDSECPTGKTCGGTYLTVKLCK